MVERDFHLTMNSYSYPKIDGQLINICNISEALYQINTRLKEARGFTFFTLNLDHLVKRRDNQAFLLAYHSSDFVCADGFPIVLLSRLKGYEIERTTGADLLRPLCQIAAEQNIPIYLFGSTKKSLNKATSQLKFEYPNLLICGALSPSMNFSAYSAESDLCADMIAKSGAALCFVLLGAPKQELFAYRQSKRYPNIGFLCLGAALDFISKEQIRAPLLFQKLNMEWAWRLILNPKRMASRYFKCALLFMKLLLRNK